MSTTSTSPACDRVRLGKLLLTASAVFLILFGAVLNLAPEEAAATAGLEGGSALPWQLLAGALIGVGVLNAYSRGRPFGGIYGRPLGLANLLLFVVGAFALGRAASGGKASPTVWTLLVIYAAFAAAFVWVVFADGPKLRPGESE